MKGEETVYANNSSKEFQLPPISDICNSNDEKKNRHKAVLNSLNHFIKSN